MTAQEERLVVELHAKWGNRWSKIARKLPGRTDNEIKNYWRTHMRKQAQEERRGLCSSSSSSSSSNNPAVEFGADTGPEKFFDSGGSEISPSSSSNKKMDENQELGDPKGYPMDDIWKDIDLSDHESLNINQEDCHFSCPALHPPSSWDYYCRDSLSTFLLPSHEKLFSGSTNQINPSSEMMIPSEFSCPSLFSSRLLPENRSSVEL